MVCASDILTVQSPVLLVHAPLQPLNVEPELVSGVAVRITLLPLSKSAAQIVPQLIFPSLLVTLPLPVPDFLIASEKVVCCSPINA
ncbi:hypothetical protein CXB77_16760 [Chromatium okenii]|uniref:Uncharacterized protein n=1 Tax=Chromatium okenii TaxID=61644 RepID=A0A2S7XQL5_9GAMM|nr:hypothetical protein CXB77_16760 [Chromatium okenii]